MRGDPFVHIFVYYATNDDDDDDYDDDDDDAGQACEMTRTPRPQLLADGFESGLIQSTHWSLVEGGHVTSGGCGALLPVAHGKSLYFDGCRRRQAVTAELDLTTARS